MGGRRDFVKTYITDNSLRAIDLGASAMYWSYPECLVIADAYPNDRPNTTFINIDFDDSQTWSKLLDYVNTHGKFSFSICSHTLEDVFNPLELIKLLETISSSGFIAVPSKYDECCKLYDNVYRGNAHHKQFFDIKNDRLVLYPKYSWIENNEKTDIIVKQDKGRELSFFWTDSIPVKLFGNGMPFNSDDALINAYYNELID